MKVIVSRIPEEGLELRYSLQDGWFQGHFSPKDPSMVHLLGAEVLCSLRKIRQTVYLNGTVEASLASVCSRCLEEASLSIEGPFRYIFDPAVDGEVQDERELSAGEMEFVSYEEDLIDLDPVIFEQIMLQVPIKVLCREACQGLCPRCGVNLNQEPCHCDTDIVDERLAVLKGFKVK